MESERDVMASRPLSEVDEFLPGARLNAALKSKSTLTGPDDEASQSRTVEWPQTASNSRTADLPSPRSDSAERSATSAGAALNDSAEPHFKLSQSFQDAAAPPPAELPFAETILPGLNRGIGANATTASAIPQIQASPTPPLQPTAEVAHMKSTLVELNTDYRELRDRIVAQDSSLKRVGHHLEKVREAKDRNTHELREWIEELKGAGGKIAFVAIVAFALLGTSVIIDIMVYLHAF